MASLLRMSPCNSSTTAAKVANHPFSANLGQTYQTLTVPTAWDGLTPEPWLDNGQHRDFHPSLTLITLTPARKTGIISFGTLFWYSSEFSNIERAVCTWSWARVANSNTASSIPRASEPFRNTSSWTTPCFDVISVGITKRPCFAWYGRARRSVENVWAMPRWEAACESVEDDKDSNINKR